MLLIGSVKTNRLIIPLDHIFWHQFLMYFQESMYGSTMVLWKKVDLRKCRKTEEIISEKQFRIYICCQSDKSNYISKCSAIYFSHGITIRQKNAHA